MTTGNPPEPPSVDDESVPADERTPLFAAIRLMSVSERMQFARRADKAGRALLARDSNKQVALTVFSNPRITIQEVEQFAKSRQLDSDLLREIALNIEWMKHYSVVLALAANPKTPITIAMKLLPRLRLPDLKALKGERNLPAAVRAGVLRLFTERSSKE